MPYTARVDRGGGDISGNSSVSIRRCWILAGVLAQICPVDFGGDYAAGAADLTELLSSWGTL